MRTILMSALFWLALTAVAYAATGDALFIQADNVTLRQGPSLEAPVSGQVNRGDRLYELGRESDWIQVGGDKVGDPLGWVHDSLVGRVWPKVELSAGKATALDADLLALMRRLSHQIDQHSREVQDLRREIRELKIDVGHLGDKVARLR